MVLGLMKRMYFDLFRINPGEYLRPDANIPDDRRQYIDEVLSWGRSVGHSRRTSRATPTEMAAIAALTGADLPTTPAQAAGGHADQGGYYPYQRAPTKGEGRGRSRPYTRAASFSSSGSWSWSAWNNWSNWSSWGWRD